MQALLRHGDDTRRVVAAIFEAPQAADHDIPRSLATDVTHDAAHVRLLSVDAPTDLPRAELWCLEAQRPKLFGDALENLAIALALRLQLPMPPRDVLVDLELERVEHLVHGATCLRVAQPQHALQPLLNLGHRDAHRPTVSGTEEQRKIFTRNRANWLY